MGLAIFIQATLKSIGELKVIAHDAQLRHEVAKKYNMKFNKLSNVWLLVIGDTAAAFAGLYMIVTG